MRSGTVMGLLPDSDSDQPTAVSKSPDILTRTSVSAGSGVCDGQLDRERLQAEPDHSGHRDLFTTIPPDGRRPEAANRLRREAPRRRTAGL